MVGWGQNVKVLDGLLCSSTMTDLTTTPIKSIQYIMIDETTPPANRRLSLECPPAPARAIKTNTIALHRGAGILPGDFIKPDPTMTQRETRQYVLAELTRWLTAERICTHAKEIAVEEIMGLDMVGHLAEGTWPAARLFTVLKTLERENNVVLPGDYEERCRFVGTWAAGICSDYLQGRPLETPSPRATAASLALGFVQTDKLPSGVVIESFWNYSPFGALLNAPPLSEPDLPVSPAVEGDEPTDEETDEATDEATDEETDEATDEAADEAADEEDAYADDEGEDVVEYEDEGEGTASYKDYVQDVVTNFLIKKCTITLPVWVFATAASAAGLYVWASRKTCA